jgi:MtrB/PioB family decaheme-associated outer membrane protein
MKSTSSQGKLIALAAGALLWAALSPAAAQDTAAQSGFSFRLDPMVIEAINKDVDNNSARFEEYRDLDSGFRVGLHLLGQSADGEKNLDLRVVNGGRTDGRYTLTYGVPGEYGLVLDYNKIPHHFGNDGHTLYTRTGPGTYELNDAMQQAIEANLIANRPRVTFDYLNNLLAPFLATAQAVDVGLERDRTLARFDLGKMGPWNLGLEYTHESRNGTRPFGSSFGFNNVTELAEPIDYDTTGAEVSGEWSGKMGGLRVGYRYSKFENNVSTLIWDNPFRFTDSTDGSAYSAPGTGSVSGSAHGFADLAADNKSNQLFLSGRAKLGGSWWLNGSASHYQMKQNDPLLPYTLNSSIVGVNFDGSTFDPTNPANLPQRTADQEAVTTNVTAQLGGQLGQDFDLTFHYRYYDYDDKASRVEFPGYVRFHAVWEEVARITVPSVYTVQDAGAELGWDMATRTHLALSFNRQSWDRKFREIKTSDEDVVKLALDTHPNTHWSLRGSYEHGDRTIGDYNTNASEDSFLEEGGVSTNIPGLRKYDEAARKYDAYKFLAQWLATDAWNFSFGVNGTKNDYNKSDFGLLSDDIIAYNAELDYTPSDKVSFFLFGQRSDRTSKQRDRQSGATPSTNPLDDWFLDIDEINDTWGLGLNAKLAEQWTTQLSGQWMKSDGNADFTAFAGGATLGSRTAAQDIPNYEDIKLLTLLYRLDYHINPHTTAGVFYRYEDFTIDSFILQGLQNYLPGALLINANNGDYTANILGLTMSLSF